MLAQSVGGTTSGTASYCAGNNSGFISLNGYNGNIDHWESSEDLITWTNLGNPTASQSYNNLLVTTHYRAIVQSGSFPPDTSTVSTVTIFIPSEGGTITGGGTFCDQSGTGSLNLTGYTGLIIDWETSTNGGLTWSSLGTTASTYNYPNTSQNVSYRAIVENVPGCPLDTSDIASIQIDSFSEAGDITGDTNVCINSNSGLIEIANQNGQISYWALKEDGGNWTDSSFTGTTLSFTNLSVTTSYVVVVQNGVCPSDTSEISIVNVQPLPQVDAGTDASILRYQDVVLNGTGTGTPSWTPASSLDNAGILSPTATPLETTVYYLTIADEYGCTNYDSTTVEVHLPLPNAITPNNDGVNDFFEIEDIETATTSSLIIFNRQGQEVYSSSPYLNDWYGTNSNNQDLADGVYYYELIINENEPLTGFIIIKR